MKILILLISIISTSCSSIVPATMVINSLANAAKSYESNQPSTVVVNPTPIVVNSTIQPIYIPIKNDFSNRKEVPKETLETKVYFYPAP